MRLLFIIVFGVFFQLSSAQSVNITSVELNNGKVSVHYTLSDENPERRYSVYLYTSNDNFIQPMKEVTGDVGVDIPVGGAKKLVWNAREEMGNDFNKDISLEVKGNVYVPFITLSDFAGDGSFKRATTYPFQWAGGRGDNILTFELFRGDKKVHIFEEKPNNGKANLTIPSKIPPGTGYRLKISDKKNRDEIVYSEPFEVKRKIPLYYTVGGGVIAAGILGVVINMLIPEPPIPDNPGLPEN